MALPACLGSLLEESLTRIADQITHDPDGNQFPDILTVEEWTDELMRCLGQGIMGLFIDIRSRQARQMPMKCTQCGKSMQRHRSSAWSRQTLWGEIRVQDDGYYYCRDCGKSARPLHNYLGTERETWSLLVQ